MPHSSSKQLGFLFTGAALLKLIETLRSTSRQAQRRRANRFQQEMLLRI